MRIDFVVSIACDRREISLDNSCIELTSVGGFNEDKPNSRGRNQGWSISGIVCAWLRLHPRTIFNIIKCYHGRAVTTRIDTTGGRRLGTHLPAIYWIG